jgi:drug/metabolite transporter (DMT)-like permease
VTLGIVHTGLLYVLLYGAVQKLSTSAVALMSFLYPATALGFDVVVYGLRPGPVQGAGILLIVGAVLAERLGQGGSQKLAVAVRTEEQKEPEV